MSALSAKNTALLIIDLISDFCFEDGTQIARAALPAARRLSALRQRAQRARVPNVFVNDHLGRWKSDFKSGTERRPAPAGGVMRGKRGLAAWRSAELPRALTRLSLNRSGGFIMVKATPEQQRSVGRVMHEFKHHELKSGPGGKGGPVKSRRQAIAIALHEAGESRSDSALERHKSLSHTKIKEARGETYQQASEGKARIGARGQRESTPAMGGGTASARSSRTRKPRTPARQTTKSARSRRAKSSSKRGFGN